MSAREYQTKKRIVTSFCELGNPITAWGVHNQIAILVYSNSWPVEFSWDSTLFPNQFCVAKSFFTRTTDDKRGVPVVDPERFPWLLSFAAMQSRLSIDTSSNWILYQPYSLINYNVMLTNGTPVKRYSFSFFIANSLQSTTSVRSGKKH